MVQLSQNTLTDFVRQVVSGYHQDCERNQVDIVLDLEDVATPFDQTLVHRAVIAMVENAIESMPLGGELEVTLVNAEYQWELEVADSGTPADNGDRTNNSDASLPRVFAVAANTHINRLNQLSILMNATIQSWNCPLGGTANVLVVPKMSAHRAANDRRAA